MNPILSGTAAGSFSATLAAISAPAETRSLDVSKLQLTDMQELFDGEEGFPELLEALRQLLPETALQQVEALAESGKGLPPAVAESIDGELAGALLVPPPALALSLARQVGQAPVDSPATEPLPSIRPLSQSQLQPTTLPASLLVSTQAQATPGGEGSALPSSPLLPEATPLPPATALSDALRALAGRGEGQGETDPTQLLARVVQSEAQTAAQPAGVALLKTVEAAAALRSPTPLTLETPVGARGWEQGIGERVLWMLGNSVQSASLRLNPAHLGPIEIQVSIQHEQASVTFTAQHAPVREALELGLPRLREMFVENSLQLASVDIGQRGQSGQAGGGFAQGSSGSGGRFGGDDYAPADAEHGAEGVAVRLASDALLDDYA
ncbi:MAG: flagellar hook-length control protein FliK [Gammaproteobacteria bacterium]|nr:flagellar hook-length control protein FliK [Gammaproteobacteria bacterium]